MKTLLIIGLVCVSMALVLGSLNSSSRGKLNRGFSFGGEPELWDPPPHFTQPRRSARGFFDHLRGD